MEIQQNIFFNFSNLLPLINLNSIGHFVVVPAPLGRKISRATVSKVDDFPDVYQKKFETSLVKKSLKR